MILRITSELQRKIKILTRKIPNPKKTFGLVLMFALVGMVHLYIQQKDTRITELQNELRLVSFRHACSNRVVGKFPSWKCPDVEVGKLLPSSGYYKEGR